MDRFGREIPDDLYGTKDFERLVSLLSRTRAVANHLTQHLRSTDPMAKTIVFCVDQEHAEDMRLALAFNAPLATRRERAQQLKSKRANYFNTFTPATREVLNILLEKYADFGLGQLTNWNEVLKIPPLSERGTTLEIAQLFGGPAQMREAVEKLQALLYVD